MEPNASAEPAAPEQEAITNTEQSPAEPPAVQEPASGNRVLTGLLKVASVFAPLVGQDSLHPSAKRPHERRGQLAAAMGAVGILLASLQLLTDAFDLVSRPAAVLGKFLPYVIVILLVSGDPGGRRGSALLPATPAQAGGSLPGCHPSGWIGLGWDHGLCLAASAPGVSGADRRFRRLQRDPQGRFRRADRRGVGGGTCVMWAMPSPSSAVWKPTAMPKLLAAGRKRKAGMVIWGAYDDFGVTPRRTAAPAADRAAGNGVTACAQCRETGGSLKPPTEPV